MLVSFIIPAYQSERTIIRTIKSITDLSCPQGLHEIIIVDSSPEYPQYLDGILNADKRIHLHHLNQKTSPAKARNIGAQYATGEVLVFLDSDAYLAKDWLTEVQKCVDAGGKVGGGAINLPPEQQKNFLAKAQWLLQFNEWLSFGSQRTVSLLPACNLFCEKSLFHEVGGFPELRASEDTLFCLRVSEITSIWFLPAAKCFHIFRENWGSFLRNQVLLGKYIMIYRRHHYASWFYHGAWPVIFFPGFLLIKLCRMGSRIFASGSKFQRDFLLSSPVFMLGLVFWGAGFLSGCFENDGC